MTLINLVKARSRQKDAAVIRSDPVQAQHADRVTAQDLVLPLVRQPLQVLLGESSAATMCHCDVLRSTSEEELSDQ
jgi:hypothetical protein